MSLITDGWTQSVQLTLDNTNVDSNQSNFIAFISERASGWPQSSINYGDTQCRQDGRDIRFTTDSAGENEIPVDVLEWNNNMDSGVTTGAAANKLIYASGQFITDNIVKPGDSVWNVTDGTSAVITAVDSETQLTLSADIMTASEQFIIGKCRVKVKVPTLNSGSTTNIHMWWGNSTASLPAPSDTYGREKVYTSNGIYASWPLNQAQGEDAIDHSPQGWDGSIQGNPVNAVGKLVRSQSFDGTTDRFDIDGSGTEDQFEGNGDAPPVGFSGSAWVYWNGAGDGDTKAIFGKRESGGDFEGWELNVQSDEKVRINVDGGTNNAYVESATTLLANTWYFIWFITDNSGNPNNFILGINGADDSNAYGSSISTGIQNSERVGIGSRKGNSASNEWRGRLESLNFYNTEKTVEWFKAQYHNQNSVPTFVSCGTVQTYNSFPSAWNIGAKVKLSGAEVPISGTVFNYISIITESQVNDAFWNLVQDGGGSIRFAENVDGSSQLPIEVVICDVALKKLEVWVRKDIEPSGSGDIYIFYQANTTVNQPNPNTTYGRNLVWTPSGFVGVWHLPEQGDGTPGEYLDSTGTGNDGVGNLAPIRVDGLLGYAQQGNGSNQKIDIGDTQFPVGNNKSSMTAWINLNGDTSEQTPFGYGTDANGQRRVLQQRSQGIGIHFSNCFVGIPTLQSGWTHIVAIVPQGATSCLNDTLVYINSVLVTNQLLSGFDLAPNTVKNVKNIMRGTSGAFASRPVDECRITTEILSEDWIKLDYMTQLDPSDLWKLDECDQSWNKWNKPNCSWKGWGH